MAGLTSDGRQRRTAGEYFEGRIRVRSTTRIRGWPREDGLGEDGLEEGGLGRMAWRRMVSELGCPELLRYCRGRFGGTRCGRTSSAVQSVGRPLDADR